MRIIKKYGWACMLGVLIPYSINDWQWWAWDIGMILAVTISHFEFIKD